MYDLGWGEEVSVLGYISLFWPCESGSFTGTSLAVCLCSYISRISFLSNYLLFTVGIARYMLDIFDLVVSRRHFNDFWPTPRYVS